MDNIGHIEKDAFGNDALEIGGLEYDVGAAGATEQSRFAEYRTENGYVWKSGVPPKG